MQGQTKQATIAAKIEAADAVSCHRTTRFISAFR